MRRLITTTLGIALVLGTLTLLPLASAGCETNVGITACDYNNDGTIDGVSTSQGVATPAGYASANAGRTAYSYNDITWGGANANAPGLAAASVSGGRYAYDTPWFDYDQEAAFAGVWTPAGTVAASAVRYCYDLDYWEQDDDCDFEYAYLSGGAFVPGVAYAGFGGVGLGYSTVRYVAVGAASSTPAGYSGTGAYAICLAGPTTPCDTLFLLGYASAYGHYATFATGDYGSDWVACASSSVTGTIPCTVVDLP